MPSLLPSIPASDKVSVIPSVISAGGAALVINGLALTTSYRVPIGTVAPFASALNVGNFFGLSSVEYARAVNYFNAFDNSNQKPASLLFAQYPAVAVGAWLQGGAINLAAINATPAGTITVTANGTLYQSASINLTGVVSPSAAAAAIQAGFTSPPFTVTYDSVSGAFLFQNTNTGTASTIGFAESTDATASACTCTATPGDVLTVGGTITGIFQVGDIVTGTDGTHAIPANTTILSQLSGTTGGAGTYQLSNGPAANMTSAAVTSTGYTGTISSDLKLSVATGATNSQGAGAAVPGTFMNGVTAVTQNWVTFFNVYDPDNGVGNAQKLLFAAWVAASANRYCYICEDTDTTPTTTVPATASMGYLLGLSQSNGTCLIFCTAHTGLAAMVSGMAAAVNYTQLNGCITFDFKYQSGMAPQVTNQTVAQNLRANGYNYYGSWATANQSFNFFDNGSVSGTYLWLDAYINQIWLNNALQLALFTLLTNVYSIPYGNAGVALLKAACNDPINQALNFGMFQPGVLLSAAQIAEVNNAAGTAIDQVLATQGWYLQILPAIAQVRAARQSPPMTLWYIYRESVQQINLASVEVE